MISDTHNKSWIVLRLLKAKIERSITDVSSDTINLISSMRNRPAATSASCHIDSSDTEIIVTLPSLNPGSPVPSRSRVENRVNSSNIVEQPSKRNKRKSFLQSSYLPTNNKDIFIPKLHCLFFLRV